MEKNFFFRIIILDFFKHYKFFCLDFKTSFCNNFNKKIHGFLVIFLLIFSKESHGDIGRKTSFDNRQQCELNQGVWREFGNGCVDECYAKFDEFGVCTYARTFGCDCGRGKCWNGEECIAVLEYKKIFDDLKQRDINEMTQAKKKRIAEAKKYQQDLIKRMIENRSALTVAKYNTDDVIIPHNNFSNNNYSEVYNQKFPQISQGKQYVTNFDERYGSGNYSDQNRLKSIQFQAPKTPEVIAQEAQQNQEQNNASLMLNNPNQNQQLIIQQPGMENQLIQTQTQAQNQILNNQPTNQILPVPPPAYTKPVNGIVEQSQIIEAKPKEKAVESFEIPMDFLKNDKNKDKELQLPIIDLPR
jgi:hypothetical protein